MRRALYVLLFSLSSLGIAQNASAGFVLSMEPNTTEYTPGTPLLVDILLTSPTGGDQLSDYSIDIVLGSDLGTAGTDFWFGEVDNASDLAVNKQAALNPFFLTSGLSSKSVEATAPNTEALNISAAMFSKFGETEPASIPTNASEILLVGRLEIFTTLGAGDLSLGFGDTLSVRDQQMAANEKDASLISTKPAPIHVARAGSATAVPEPTSIGILSFLGLSGLFRNPLRKLRTRRRAVA
ncbi:hypothetical protein [Roseimaritima sediminicola]|uniref:hypothetical protein n=1 Tax=Roseimaritima sediminicola TaxID=2662066 RepID=UPI0012984C25|nr:hypothetical protein [Roseimaritima sediminicola]